MERPVTNTAPATGKLAGDPATHAFVPPGNHGDFVFQGSHALKIMALFPRSTHRELRPPFGG